MSKIVTLIDNDLSEEIYPRTKIEAIQNKRNQSLPELLDNKVDKVNNKQLSTNDYTDEDKQIVQNSMSFTEDLSDEEINNITYADRAKYNWDGEELATKEEINNKIDKPTLCKLGDSSNMMFSNGTATLTIPKGRIIFDFEDNLVTLVIITQSLQDSEDDLSMIVFKSGSTISYNIPSSMIWYDDINDRTDKRVELTIQNNCIR